MPPNRAHQELMIDRLEESLDVEIEHPVTSPASLPSDVQSFFRRFPWPISIGIRMKMRLQNRLQKARDYHLRDPICNRWYAQRSHSAVTFGNLDATYWRRVVAARCQSIPELVKITG